MRDRHGAALIVVALVVAALPPHVFSASHKFKDGDIVPLYANLVGPYNNPSETYEYYRLPFCAPPEGPQYKLEDLGEVRAQLISLC